MVDETPASQLRTFAIPMSWFQLDPQTIADRARANGSTAPTLGASLLRGILGFAAVSVAGFVPWAVFGRAIRAQIGEPGVYATCALVFIGLSAPALHRLMIGPESLARFYKLFSLAFAAYAVAWIVGWMSLQARSMNAGSLAGLLAGTVVMGAMLAAAFDAWASLVQVILALFLLNSLGYFIGGVFEGMLIHTHPILAKLQWGICYGLGFGAGLGLAFHLCQSRARALLAGPK
jgi:hypothetical protein